MINRLQSLMAEKGQREKRVILVKELSEVTGINRQTILSWRNNDIKRFDADVIEAFLKFFDCTIADLLVHEPEERVKEPA